MSKEMKRVAKFGLKMAIVMAFIVLIITLMVFSLRLIAEGRFILAATCFLSNSFLVGFLTAYIAEDV